MIAIPILLVATAWFKKNIKAAFQDVRKEVSNINTFVQEHIVGMNLVQIFNREDAELKKFQDINKGHLSAHLKSVFYYSVFFPVVEILSALSIGMIIWYGGEAIVSGKDVTLGELVAFILYIHMMFRPIRQLADRFNVLQMGIVGSERVFKVLDTEDFITDEGSVEKENIDGEVEYKNVKFAYKNEDWVLNGLSFKIEKGKNLALVGRTGAGKTSIINILNRFYEIQEGKISIDGVEIRDFKLSNLRKHIAVVQQEVHLFSSSIMENIVLFDENINEESVIDAAKEIGIHNFIMSLPGGYNYIVGERGVTLSTGQRQLISFLRVYLRNPKILILDEATSSIDSYTEQILQNALQKISEGRTTIVIAHRLSTIVNSDKILLLENGKVLEEGSHSKLMNENGEYAQMYNTQISDKL
jgi:ATP-binding cassette subfamily B multidrug efflux pump